jgi:hypothetical protein
MDDKSVGLLFIILFFKKILKIRENFKRSGEKSFPNLNRLLHLKLNFVKFIEIGPNAH